MKELTELAEIALRTALAEGAEHCDVASSRGRELYIEFEAGAVKNATTDEGQGLAVRAFCRGGRGMTSVDGGLRGEVERAAAEAAQMARQSEADPDFKTLPVPSEAQDVGDLYDPRCDELTAEDVIKIVSGAIEEARSVDSSAVISGGLSVHSSLGAVLNSNGVRVCKQNSMIEFFINVISKRDDDVGSFYDFDMGHGLSDVQFEGLGRSTAEKAQRYLNARKVSPGRLDLVLGPIAAYGFLHGLADVASAENVQRGRSFLAGKLGQKIASNVLTIWDDGLVQGGLFSGAYDGEGAPRKKVCIIGEGVLEAYLHNSYTAGKAGVANTGHGRQSGAIEPTNSVPVLGDRTSEAIIRETADGILIEIGHLSADAVSGNISCLIDYGMRIENGQVTHPVVNTMVGSDIFEVLTHIDAVSSDYRAEPGNILPTVRIRDVQVA